MILFFFFLKARWRTRTFFCSLSLQICFTCKRTVLFDHIKTEHKSRVVLVIPPSRPPKKRTSFPSDTLAVRVHARVCGSSVLMRQKLHGERTSNQNTQLHLFPFFSLGVVDVVAVLHEMRSTFLCICAVKRNTVLRATSSAYIEGTKKRERKKKRKRKHAGNTVPTPASI